MRLTGKEIAFLVAPAFEDLEFWVVYMRLVEEGAKVHIVGTKRGQRCLSKSGGLSATVETTPDALRAESLAGVVIPGGWAPDKLRRDLAVLSLVREVHARGKIVGMICHAGLVGISAGIVAGHDATGSLGIKDDLVNGGARWVDRAAFRSGNLVWGRVVEDIPAFCRELVGALAET